MRELSRATYLDLEELLAEDRPVVLLLPLGALEPHGPHAPLGTDTLISVEVSERAARRLQGDPDVRALVLPALPYGVTRYAAAFPGAVSIGEETLRALVFEICTSLAAQGFGRIVLVNSHFEPEHVRTLRDASSELGPGVRLLDPTRRQVLDLTGALPTAVTACVGGGSNAIGIFHAFLDDVDVRLVGYEAGGEGVDTERHAATITKGRPGVLHGARSYLLQDEDGQTIESHSISAGLDYPGVGPEHSWLKDVGRAEYVAVTDEEALEALALLTRLEGIIPALESAHAVAHAVRLAATMPRESRLVIGLSGRGDKDVETVRAARAAARGAAGRAAGEPRVEH